MEERKVFLVHGTRDMKRVAQWVKRHAPSPARRRATLLALTGDLGSGKTTFVTALARACGVRARVASPSFVLLRTYQGAHSVLIHHIDAWRITARAVRFLGVPLLMEDPCAFVCVEWADRARRALPRRNVVWMRFEHVSPRERKVTIRRSAP